MYSSLYEFYQDHISSNETSLTDELIAVLSELTKLNNQENSKVALRARQVRS